MAHVFQTFDKKGKPHPRFKFEYRDWRGRRRKGTGTTSEKDTEKLAHHVQADQDAIRRGWKPVPKASDIARDYPGTAKEYAAWGEASGGRRGFGWSKTHAGKKKSALVWWADRLNLQTIKDIELPDVEGALRELLAQGLTGKTVQGYSEAIASFCDWCVSRQYLDADPLAALAAFDCTPKTPHRELCGDEIQKLLAATPPARALVYRVALATGYRQNELRCLTVGRLDMFGPSLPLAAEFCKDRRDARQPISRELADELAALAVGKAPDAPLLPIPRKETCGENLDRDFTKAGITRNLNGGRATFHSFRVNYINAVVKSGADLKTIMTLARHSSATMSMSTYAKPDAQRLRDCAELVADAMKQVAAAPVITQRVAVGAEGKAVNVSAAAVCMKSVENRDAVRIPAGTPSSIFAVSATAANGDLQVSLRFVSSASRFVNRISSNSLLVELHEPSQVSAAFCVRSKTLTAISL